MNKQHELFARVCNNTCCLRLTIYHVEDFPSTSTVSVPDSKPRVVIVQTDDCLLQMFQVVESVLSADYLCVLCRLCSPESLLATILKRERMECVKIMVNYTVMLQRQEVTFFLFKKSPTR